MPVIPTYRAGVGAPNLAEAYLGSRRIAQQAASDAARIALGREQLAQEAIVNQMELAAKREAMAQQAMKQAQEAEIEKAYRETQIGLRERELANEIQDAARDFERQQRYQRRVQELTPTMGVEEASRRAILEGGGTGLSTALERPRAPSEIPALNFQLSQLNAMERSIMDAHPYGLNDATPEELAQIEDIRKRRNALQIPQSLQQQPTVTGTNAPRRLRVVRDASGKLVIQK